ncbi:DUF202 domain-containing protein [Flavobacteriaceae bacterium Ap0902]|nr:DUF202 domain-containing protein [Flavobacteriaceae bacterium Ap0902]
MTNQLKRRGKKVKKLVKFTDEYDVKEKIILRDHLALQRTKLANERTLLTYVRSALYLIIAGLAFIGMKDFESMPYLGEICFVVSIIILMIGFVRFYQLKKQLNKVYKDPDLQLEDDD